MNIENIIKDINGNPQKHRHTFGELYTCCIINGMLNMALIDVHYLGENGGRRCDVIDGPCSCGAWH